MNSSSAQQQGPQTLADALGDHVLRDDQFVVAFIHDGRERVVGVPLVRIGLELQLGVDGHTVVEDCFNPDFELEFPPAHV
eukprot:CAMPEP_0116901742 /NCGR_PEP_ID=MMETSP0467-20121206/9562_1 /TAXON_ID=283647 /ORGANISM="Mesodinium pulex, Strain SPMC105" /LENGTH=79 /DNA_ID=CAMNT_0004575369 /DNA_START=198 /DNA_END=432 /DNA_ORIENTATION=+